MQDGLPPIPPVDTKSVITNPSGNFNVVPPNYKTGYAQQGNFGIEQEIPQWAMVLKVAYVTNLARQVDSNFNINTPDPGPGNAAVAPSAAKHSAQCGECDLRRHYGHRQLSLASGDRGAAFYKGIVVAGRLHVLAFDRQRADAAGRRGGWSGPPGHPIPLPGPRQQQLRYPASYDAERHLRSALRKGTPFRNLSNSVANAIFGGWQVNGILTCRVDCHLRQLCNVPCPNSGASRPDRLESGELSNPTITRWFDTSFGTARRRLGESGAVYTYGNGGRNILRGTAPDQHRLLHFQGGAD